MTIAPFRRPTTCQFHIGPIPYRECEMKMPSLQHPFRAPVRLIAGALAMLVRLASGCADGQRRSRFWALVIAAGLFASATPAAACTFGGDYASGPDFGTVHVPRDVSGAGGQIGVATRTVTWNCPAKTTKLTVINVTPTAADAASGKFDYSALGVAGVGLTLDIEVTSDTKVETLSSGKSYGWSPTDSSKPWTGTATFVWKLWKTDFMSLQHPNYGSPMPSVSDRANLGIFLGTKRVAQMGNISARFDMPVCWTSATHKNAVTLPKLRMSDFEGKNVAGEKRLDIELQCPAGAPVKLYMTLTDAQTPANRSSVLTPSAGTTAKGVGVQILDSKGIPVVFGEATAKPGNRESRLITELAEAPSGVGVALTARYIRRQDEALSPGVVRSLLQFTLSYQ